MQICIWWETSMQNFSCVQCIGFAFSCSQSMILKICEFSWKNEVSPQKIDPYATKFQYAHLQMVRNKCAKFHLCTCTMYRFWVLVLTKIVDGQTNRQTDKVKTIGCRISRCGALIRVIFKAIPIFYTWTATDKEKKKNLFCFQCILIYVDLNVTEVSAKSSMS